MCIRDRLDTLLGEHTIRKLFIVHENGNSLNEAIDRGQIEGAVLQGIGWCTMEDLIYDEKGLYLSANPSTYKIPGIRNLPAETYIEIIPSATEEASVFGSKGIGEPPSVSYTHLRAHETVLDLVCRLLLEKKKNKQHTKNNNYM